MPIPPFEENGDLPPGVHVTSLGEALRRFASSSTLRRSLGERLVRIYLIATATNHLGRFVVFGSFVTDEPAPHDVDIFMLMNDEFEVGLQSGDEAILFDHAAAQSHFGASVFWLRRVAAWEGEQAAVEYWQVKRDGSHRGILEIVETDS